MRNNLILAMLLLCAGFPVQRGSAAGDDLVARLHFVGTTQMGTETNASSLKKIAAMPESIKFREATLQKLATVPFRLFQTHLAGGNTNNFLPLLEPLLDDLLRSESYAEMRGPTNLVPEMLLAVRVGKTRAQLWQTNLATALSTWTGIATTNIQSEGFSGWELKKHHQPDVIRLFLANDWVVFGWGVGDLRLQSSLLQRIKTTGRPVEIAKTNWLDIWADLPALATNHPAWFPFNPPKCHLIIQGRTNYIRPELTLQYPESLGITLDPWQIPTNIIHSPFNSFTAYRGIAPLLAKFPILKQLKADPLPNQLFVWAREKAPLETLMAVPVKDATNYLDQFGPNLVSAINSNVAPHIVMREAQFTNHLFFVSGVPFLTPYLRPTREPAGDFLVSGFFSNIRTPKDAPPMPPEILDEIYSRPKLAYYDWEVNAQRIEQWKTLGITLIMVNDVPIPTAELPGQIWLQAVKNELGYCATTASLTAPNEITILRNGPLGLSGIELTALVFWMDAPGFPLECHYNRPQRPKNLPKRNPPATAPPAAK